MAEPFHTKNWRAWVQPNGPNTAMQLLGCITMDDIEESGGGIKDLIRCFKADGTGWDSRGSTRNPPDPIATTATELVEQTASWLEKIVESGRCPFPLYVNGKSCPPFDVFNGAERTYTIEDAEIGTATLSGTAHRDEDNISEQAFEITGLPPLRRVRRITSERITIAEYSDLNDIWFCNTPRCASDCSSAAPVCEDGLAVSDAPAGSPAVVGDVWHTADEGESWAIPAADPFDVGEDIMAVTCFAVDSNTTRWLVAREAVVAEAMQVSYSDDAGANWTDVALATANNVGALSGCSLFALDMYHIWLVLNSGEIFFSSDGGLTWIEQSSPVATALWAVWFSDANTGMAVGAADVVIVTTNGGTTWASATATGGGNTNQCVGENATGRIWWVGDSGGHLWYSTDQGTTWTERTFSGSGAGSIHDVQFATKTVGFMIHNPTDATGRMYRTRNGGTDWELIGSQVAGELLALYVCSPNEAFAVGEVAGGTALLLKAHD